jgi:hypothetical protein
VLIAGQEAVAMLRYSTGCVKDYAPCGVTPDLPATIPEGQNFRFWYNLGGFTLFTRWENGNVFGSDFRDGATSDLDPGGGSDIPEIYLFCRTWDLSESTRRHQSRFHPRVWELR